MRVYKKNMSIITVRKTRLAEAIQINTPEDESIVRQWLIESGMLDEADEADLEELKAQRVYFLRDQGSPIVYLTTAEDFTTYFEQVEDATEGFRF